MDRDRQDRLKTILLDNSSNGRLGCEVAHRLAKEYNFSLAEIGQMANQLKIKIESCQLGCF